MMTKFLSVFLFLVVYNLWAQPALEVSTSAQMVYSKYDHCFMVLDDSTHYFTYRPSRAQWEKKAMVFLSASDWPFEKFKQRFNPVAIGKQHFLFVMDGCGMVYELKNDTLRRIDQSYEQKNQFGSTLYVYKGKPFMFGGYGLFQVKNTHTYFDFEGKEWFEVYCSSKERPTPRTNPYFVLSPKKLYILGGVDKHFDYNKILNDIWAFDLKNNNWEFKGELNPDFVRRTRVRGFVQNKDYRIFHSNNQLTVVNVGKNKYYSYMSATYLPFARLIPDEMLNDILVVEKNSNRMERNVLKVLKFHDILDGRPKEYYLYKPISWFKRIPIDIYLWLSVIINFGFFFVLFYLNRYRKASWFKPRNPVLYRKDFTEVEWSVILLVYQNKELELSALNHFFDEPGLSYETLKKRRESFIKALRIKLALLSRRDVDLLLQESKHPLDKRMKIIRWNKDLEISQEE